MKTATANNLTAYATKGRVNLEQLKTAPKRRQAAKIQKLAAIAATAGPIMTAAAVATLTGAGLAWLVITIPAAIITAAALQEIENELKTPKK